MSLERKRYHYTFQLKTPVNQWEREVEIDDEQGLNYYSIRVGDVVCPCKECAPVLQSDCEAIEDHPDCCLEVCS